MMTRDEIVAALVKRKTPRDKAVSMPMLSRNTGWPRRTSPRMD